MRIGILFSIGTLLASKYIRENKKRVSQKMRTYFNQTALEIIDSRMSFYKAATDSRFETLNKSIDELYRQIRDVRVLRDVGP